MGDWILHGTTKADFCKMFSSSRKRGGADAFENDPPFRSKGTVELDFSLRLKSEFETTVQ